MKRREWIAAGLAIYAVSTLVSMAVMSTGVGIVVFAILLGLGFGGLKTALSRAWSTSRAYRLYAYAALALFAACALSLIVAMVFPLGYGGMSIHVHLLSDLAKCWYLFCLLILKKETFLH